MTHKISEKALKAFYKSLHIGERRVRKTSVFSFFKGYKKFKTWKKLSGFNNSPENFSKRLAFEKFSQYEFCILLGQDEIEPNSSVNIKWLLDALEIELSNFDVAGPLTESVLMGNLAIRSFNITKKDKKGDDQYPGRNIKLLWDGPNMRVTNFDEANQFVKRTYREGWSLGV